MSLDLTKLQNLRQHGGITHARCPACAAEGHDRRGEHLFIAPGGRFGCVVNPGMAGRSHRKKIFELVGIKDHGNTTHIRAIPIKSKKIEPPEILERDILGRLGRLQLNSVKPVNKNQPENKGQGDAVNKTDVNSAKIVPTVPEGKACNYSRDELSLIQSLDKETLEIVRYAKHCFGGTIVPPEPPTNHKKFQASPSKGTSIYIPMHKKGNNAREEPPLVKHKESIDVKKDEENTGFQITEQPEDVAGFYIGRYDVCIYCISANEEVAAVRQRNFILRGYTEDGFVPYECSRCGEYII